MKKFNELNKENQKYIKEKQILEEELNEKEQELANNKTKINDLEYQIKLLNDRLNDFKNKENNEKNIKRSNTIDYIKKSPTKIPQNVRKRDDKARTFAPKQPETYQNIEQISYLPTYDENSDRSVKLINEYNYTKEKNIYPIQSRNLGN